MKKLILALSLSALVLGSGQVAAQTKKKSSSQSGRSSSGRGGGNGGGSSGYNTGIGLRGGGYASGLTIKHFTGSGKNVAVEGLLTTEYRARGARLTLLFEKHWTIVPDVQNLQWYVGGGLHAGTYRGRYYYDAAYRYDKKGRVYYTTYYVEDKMYPVFGADLVLGLEYKIPDLPLVVGVDYKPYFDIFDGNTGFYNDAALSVRIAF